MKITQEVRDFTAKQNLDSYLASENLRAETSAEGAAEAEKGMEEMSEVYTGRRARSCICRRASK